MMQVNQNIATRGNLIVEALLKDFQNNATKIVVLFDNHVSGNAIGAGLKDVIDPVVGHIRYNDRYCKVLVDTKDIEVNDDSVVFKEIRLNNNTAVKYSVHVGDVLQIAVGWGTRSVCAFNRLTQVRVFDEYKSFPNMIKLLNDGVIAKSPHLDTFDMREPCEPMMIVDTRDLNNIVSQYNDDDHFFVEYVSHDNNKVMVTASVSKSSLRINDDTIEYLDRFNEEEVYKTVPIKAIRDIRNFFF